MADEGLLIPIQFTLEEARAALSQLESRARAAGQRAGEGVSGGMGKGLAGLKGQLGPARESMMFFTSALGEFGPAGRTAQTAVAGVGSALMAATPVLAGVAAGMALVRLATGAISESMEEADAKAKATTQALKALTDASRSAYMAEAARLAQAQGVKTFDLAQRLLTVTREEAAAKKDLAEATWAWQASSARQRVEEAQAARRQILLEEEATRKLQTKNAVIEAGRQANEAAWRRQEEEAARLTAAENKREADRKAAQAKLEAELRKEDAAVVARINAELAEEERAANERAAVAKAIEDAAERARQKEIDHESFMMEWQDRRHQETLAAIEAERQAFEASMPMDAVRAFTGSVAQAFAPVLTTSRAYQAAMRASGKATADAADLSGAAFAAMAQNAMASMATEAAGRALFETAAGLASWAWYDWAAAKTHFEAAAVYGTVAALGGAGAMAIGATRGMTAAEKASVADASGQGTGSASVGGAREFGAAGGSSGGTVTVRETVFVGVLADPFESPAETARRAARVMETVRDLDLMRRES